MKWGRAEQELKDCKSIFSVLVTPRVEVDKSAIPHAKELFAITPTEMLELFERAKAMLITIRSTMANEIDEEFKEKILSELIRSELTPNAVQELLLRQLVMALPTS